MRRTDNGDNRDDEKRSGTYRLGISEKSPTPELFSNAPLQPTLIQSASFL